jgi:hypothetical protein
VLRLGERLTAKRASALLLRTRSNANQAWEEGLEAAEDTRRPLRLWGVALSRDIVAAPHFRTIQASPKNLPQGLREIELAANSLNGPSSWRMDHADF